MKKFLSIFAIAAVLLAFVGCGTASLLPGTTWEWIAEPYSETWEFKRDGNLKVTKTYDVVGDVSTVSTKTYTYSTQKDTLTIVDSEGTSTDYTVVESIATNKVITLTLLDADGEEYRVLTKK